LDCIAFAPEESFFMHFTIAPDGGFGQALLSGINRGLGNFSLRFPVKIINDLWFKNDEVKLNRSRSPAAIADSSSFRFRHCSDINSQEHLTVPPRGNYPSGSPMAAKAAQFLAVTDKLIDQKR